MSSYEATGRSDPFPTPAAPKAGGAGADGGRGGSAGSGTGGGTGGGREVGLMGEDAVAAAARALVASIRQDGLGRLRSGVGGGASWGDGAGDSHLGGSGGTDCFRSGNLAGLRELVDTCRRIMFPGFFDIDAPWDGELDAHLTRLTAKVARLLDDELRCIARYTRRSDHAVLQVDRDGLKSLTESAFRAHVIGHFLSQLVEVRGLLAMDVQAAFDGDPAAEHTDEIILCYPGLDAIFTHRLAHVLYLLGVPILPRVIAEQAHSRTGIDIHPGARVGERFFIDHGSGTVIGETSRIGRDVKIYQGVTLGARSFPKDEHGRAIRGIKRHPTIGDRVAIYAGAVILGGDTVIGDDCVIAGGVFVTSSVPPGHVVQQTRAELVLKPKNGHSSTPGPERFTPVSGQEAQWLDPGAGI